MSVDDPRGEAASYDLEVNGLCPRCKRGQLILQEFASTDYEWSWLCCDYCEFEKEADTSGQSAAWVIYDDKVTPAPTGLWARYKAWRYRRQLWQWYKAYSNDR